MGFNSVFKGLNIIKTAVLTYHLLCKCVLFRPYFSR